MDELKRLFPKKEDHVNVMTGKEEGERRTTFTVSIVMLLHRRTSVFWDDYYPFVFRLADPVIGITLWSRVGDLVVVRLENNVLVFIYRLPIYTSFIRKFICEYRKTFVVPSRSFSVWKERYGSSVHRIIFTEVKPLIKSFRLLLLRGNF